MKTTDEYKVCTLEEAKTFARKREHMNKKNFPPHIVDGGASYQKKVEEAPYHPGYEDAVVTPAPKYTGMNPDKMLWKPKPLSDEEIHKLADTHLQTRNHDGALVVLGLEDFARAIEERHGIK
jgi:hypothetical protein